MDSELRAHLELYAQDLVRAGVSPEEAGRRARVEFGGVEARKEEMREALGLRLLDETVGDVRYAFRQLRRSPAFTAIAVFSLALGIGANTAIFSLMEAAIWKALPVKNPEQLRLLSWVSGPQPVMGSTWGNYTQTPTGGWTSTSFSYPVFQELQRGNPAFESVFAFKPVGRVTAVIDGSPELVRAELVSGNFYQSVGVTPIGRSIVPADDTRSADATVGVISDDFWTRRFGRDASVLGKQIHVNQIPVTIVGVNPPEFTGPASDEKPDVFVPLTLEPAILPRQRPSSNTGATILDDPDYWWLLVMGRLKPGVSESEAQTSLDVTLQQAVQDSLPSRVTRDRPRLRLLPGARGLDDLREEFSRPLFVLLSLVGLVLLIACANLANLLLVRAATRQREISLRLALGAGRWRITRQMLTEGLVLAVLGGAAGVLVGYWTRDGIPDLLASSWRSGPLQAAFDARVLTVSTLLTVLAGVLFSLAPAWAATRVEINVGLKDSRGASSSLPRLRGGKSLIAFQIGLSVLVLVGAGLFVRTLSNLRSTDLGFRPERIYLFTIDPPRTRYAGDRRKALFEQLEQQVETIPNIQSATISSVVLVANEGSTTNVGPDGRVPQRGEADRAWVNEVGDRFFETMGIPILQGRSLGKNDRANSPWVAVVNQQFVRKFFPSGNPLGRTFRNGNDIYQIVGICGDARYNRVRAAVPPTFYRAFTQTSRDPGSMTFELRTASTEASVVKAVREVVRSIDQDLPVFDIRTQAEQIDATLSQERLFAALTSSFGILALMLAAVGVYGVIANGVARRTSEIGIRMALGAESRQVLVMILRETALLAGAGVAIGILAASGLTRYIQAMLYGVKPIDPATIGGAVLVMLLVALLAGWIPARRASRLDPMVALRHE